MRTANRTLTIAAAMTIALAWVAPALGQAQDPDGYGDGYQTGAYGRIRSADDGATIIRADGERGEPDGATINSPIFPGDAVRTNGHQRVEVQLAGGSIVRIDANGDVVFQSLPNPSAKFKDNTVLALHAGVIRVDSRLGENDEFRIDTRAASAYLLGEGEFRLATDDRGTMRVASLRGVAEVVGNDASVLVRGGTGTAVVVGSAPDAPRAYVASSSDGFDRWCDARTDSYRDHDIDLAQTDEVVDVPEEVQPYQTELAINGTWSSDATYGSVWYPAGVSYGWRPYNNGYWSYGPGGYFWVSYEPWGWAPYHYGNWQWVGYRWGWVPGPVFAGAWVSWSWGSAYVGWAPLDYWGRPGCGGGAYYAGYYDPGSWTFVGYSNLSTRNVPRYAVPIGTVRDDLTNATVVSRAPSVDPRRIAQSPVVRQRALRQVAEDQSARLRPIQADERPARTMRDVQNQMLRRPQQGSPAARAQRNTIASPSVDPRVSAPKARRILDDPRNGSPAAVRAETRDDVRELYQRMSRPRETRAPEPIAPRHSAPSYRQSPQRVETPSARSPRQQSPQTRAPEARSPRSRAPEAVAPPGRTPQTRAPEARGQRSRASEPVAPQAQSQRPQAPRTQAPPSQAPRAQAPRAQTPRAQAPRGQAAPKGNPKNGDKH